MKTLIKKIARKIIDLLLKLTPEFLLKPIRKLCRYISTPPPPPHTHTHTYTQKFQKGVEEYYQDFINRFTERAYHNYPEESLKNKRFYNIGAGMQRSVHPYWTYVDLISESYSENNPDIAHDLESLEPLPLPQNEAEIIYNSYLMEHISWKASQNLIKDAFRCLKKGGLLHCRVHSCTYGLFLYRKGIVSDKFFFTRESRAVIQQFMVLHKDNMDFDNADSFVEGAYRITAKNGEYIEISPEDIFLAYNGTCLSKFALDHPNLKGGVPEGSAKEVYEKLFSQVEPWFQKKYPHSHNFQYIDKEMLIEEIKKAGFTEIYPVEIGQSAAPPLWEPCFNVVHSGFNFGIEAIK